MRISEKILQEIQSKTFHTSDQLSLVGLDGFVDKIVTPVNKRHGMGEQFDPIETIADLGSRISEAAGKSANLELFPRFEKLGGNGPIMANALLSLGLGVRYVGALGNPSIHPVFEEFAVKTDAISLTEPGITTALEFKDGKIMLGNMVSLEEIDYNQIIQAAGEGPRVYARAHRQDGRRRPELHRGELRATRLPLAARRYASQLGARRRRFLGAVRLARTLHSQTQARCRCA